MSKPKKKYNLKSRLTSALRKVWYYSPTRREVVKAAKQRGNTCELCMEPKDKLQVDHISPVVPTDGKPYTWDTYIERLFCPADGLRAICHECHKAVTAISSQLRKAKEPKLTPRQRKKK